MNKPNFIIKEGAYDTTTEYNSFIKDYNNQENTVLILQRKYGVSKYKRFYDKALTENRIMKRLLRNNGNSRESGIKDISIVKGNNRYNWCFHYIDNKGLKRIIRRTYLKDLREWMSRNGYSLEIIDSEQLERVKREHNVQ